MPLATVDAQEARRLGEPTGAADWLPLGGAYRIHYETLENPFRAGTGGSDQILVERLLFRVRADFDSFYVGAELEDSRAQLDDAGTPLDNGIVNPARLLRGYVGLKRDSVLIDGDNLDLSAGRITLDIGSRRLGARNGFRNAAALRLAPGQPQDCGRGRLSGPRVLSAQRARRPRRRQHDLSLHASNADLLMTKTRPAAALGREP